MGLGGQPNRSFFGGRMRLGSPFRPSKSTLTLHRARTYSACQMPNRTRRRADYSTFVSCRRAIRSVYPVISNTETSGEYSRTRTAALSFRRPLTLTLETLDMRPCVGPPRHQGFDYFGGGVYSQGRQSAEMLGASRKDNLSTCHCEVGPSIRARSEWRP
jgi:hypothetical protein